MENETQGQAKRRQLMIEIKNSGLRVKWQMLYGRDGSIAAYRVASFDDVGLVEEWRINQAGETIKPWSAEDKSLRDDDGKIPVGWGRSRYNEI